jgi:hypothetical protein
MTSPLINFKIIIMIYNIKTIPLILLAMLFGFSSCTKEDKTFGDLTTPQKPVIDVQVVGKTATAPNGDGSGNVTVTVTSANAINYKIDFGDGSAPITSTNNSQQHIYSHVGVKDVTITVVASGKAGVSSSNATNVSVLKNYVPSAELVTFLTGDNTKTWKVDSATVGHLGVGPTTSFTSEWWSAPVNDKVGQGIYDDEYTFTKAGNVFAHKTNNSLFGHKENLKDFDPSLTGTGDYTLTGPAAANYTEPFAYDGAGAVEYIIFTGKGHMGLYAGAHKYQVLTKSATQMWLRYIGTDNNAWYVRIKSK